MPEKILICDDEAAMRQMTARALKPKGYELILAEDGTQALDYVKQQRPNLLLLDMRLPDMDGLDVLGQVKKIYPEMEVIMISGFGDVEHALEALKLGAFDYISKPFKIEALHNRVAEALTKNAGAIANKLPDSASPAETPSQNDNGASFKEPVVEPAKELPKEPVKPKEDITAEDVSKSAPPKKRKMLLVVSVVVLTLIVSAGFSIWYLLSTSGVRYPVTGAPATGDFKTIQFNVPYSNPAAIVYGEGCLWVADWMTQSVYRHNLDDKLSVARVYYVKDSHITGLAWDGTNLWSCDSWAGKMYKHNFDNELSVVAEFPVLGATPGGLFWDGMHMWICDTKGGSFYKLKITPAGVEMVDAYNAPGPKPVGLFFDGVFAYSVDAKTSKIYKHKALDMSVTGIFEVPEYEKSSNVIAGMTWDGKYLWTCAEGTKKMFKHSLKGLRVAR